MGVVPGLWLLAWLNGLVLVVAIGVGGYLLLGRSNAPTVAVADWREEACELAREIQAAIDTAETPADGDHVARLLLPLVGRIQSHVREAPTAVEAGNYRGLFQLGVACQRVAIEDDPDGEVSIEDRLGSLREQAEAFESVVEEP